MKTMKTTASLLAAALAFAASTTVTTALSSHAHAAVFQPLAPNADCHAFKAEDACLAAHCSWCKAGAVPSACYTEDEAAQLPPAVFQCDKKLGELSWAINEVPSDPEHAHALFSAWKRAHSKQYASAIEDQVRSAIFLENAHVVAAHNAKPRASFTMELNQFADLSWCVCHACHVVL